MLSEAEMKEFFQRVVDEVAQLSTQASQVEGLRKQVEGLYERVNSLENANNDLRAINTEAANNLARMESELASTRSQYENEQRAVSALRETIIQRDAAVHQIQGELQVEREGHKITTSERDDARTRVRELEDSNANLHQTLRTAEEDRNGWRNKSIDLETKVNDLQQKLDRVNSILNPIRAVPSADVA